jgi:hypothetical protein
VWPAIAAGCVGSSPSRARQSRTRSASRSHSRTRTTCSPPADSPSGRAATRWCMSSSPKATASERSPGTWAGDTTRAAQCPCQSWQELVDGKWQRPRPSKLDAFKPHLQQRREQGCTNAAELYRQVTALGYAGSYALVRAHLEQYRRAPGPIAPAPPTVRQVTGCSPAIPTA